MVKPYKEVDVSSQPKLEFSPPKPSRRSNSAARRVLNSSDQHVDNFEFDENQSMGEQLLSQGGKEP